jgi:hypothetical protein
MPLGRATEPPVQRNDHEAVVPPGHKQCATCEQILPNAQFAAHQRSGCIPSRARAQAVPLAPPVAPSPAAAAAAPVPVVARAAAAATTAAAAAAAPIGPEHRRGLRSRAAEREAAMTSSRMDAALHRLRDADINVPPRDVQFLKHIIRERLGARATASLLADEHAVRERATLRRMRTIRPTRRLRRGSPTPLRQSPLPL